MSVYGGRLLSQYSHAFTSARILVHKLMQIWLTFKCTSSDARRCRRSHTLPTHTNAHAWGPGLSAITAQWNIFRLERCRITLQPDDKYSVSTIINLVPLPTFRLQTRWCKGRGACIHWMVLVPQLGLQRCGWCMHWALPCSRRSRKHKGSGHSDSLGSLVMSLFGKGRLLGWTEVLLILYSEIGAVKNPQSPSSSVAHSLFCSQAVRTLSLSFPLHSPLFLFASASSFSLSTPLPHPPFFPPKVSLTYCPEQHFIVSGHCLANEHHA